MVGHTFFAGLDVLGIALGLLGFYVGFFTLIPWAMGNATFFLFSPTGVVSNLNQFFTQLTALVVTFGCLAAALSIAAQNVLKARKDMMGAIQSTLTEVEAIKRSNAEKDALIASLQRDKDAAARERQQSAEQITKLEAEVDRLVHVVRRNAPIISGLKMESDLRRASTPDPDRPPSSVNIVNVIPPAPAPADDHGGHRA